MDYVILDLEFNGTYSDKLKKFVNEIIEFGAVKFDDNLNIIDKFSMMVKPSIGKKLNYKVRELTNITSSELSSGHSFKYVLSEFEKFLGSDILMTWGISDIQVLIQNYKYYYNKVRIPFIKSFIDLQKYSQNVLAYTDTQQLGLSTAANILGIDKALMDHHRALDDSILSFDCLQSIFDKDTLDAYVQDTDCNEFFDKVDFKVSFAKKINYPGVKKQDIEFNCNKCNGECIKLNEWKQRGNSHIAKFRCKECDNEFTAKVQIKVTYDGLIIKKSVLQNDRSQ